MSPIRCIASTKFLLVLAAAALIGGCGENTTPPATVQEAAKPTEALGLDVSDFGSFLIAKLTKKAEVGNADAQVDLGMKYYNGDGVQKDPAKAFEWLQKAAAQANAQAQFQLGELHSIGGEISLYDPTKAIEWFEKAAEQGHVDAQAKLDFN